jgi:hypothetical protein
VRGGFDQVPGGVNHVGDRLVILLGGFDHVRGEFDHVGGGLDRAECRRGAAITLVDQAEAIERGWSAAIGDWRLGVALPNASSPVPNPAYLPWYRIHPVTVSTCHLVTPITQPPLRPAYVRNVYQAPRSTRLWVARLLVPIQLVRMYVDRREPANVERMTDDE